MAAITVLIADRHALFRRSLRQLCEINGGFRVVAEATSAAELLALAAQLRPDAVLADMQLAELEGVATTRLLLADQPALITILLAFAWDDDTLERARQSGARAWLAKDCAEATLFAALRSGQLPAPEHQPFASGRHRCNLCAQMSFCTCAPVGHRPTLGCIVPVGPGSTIALLATRRSTTLTTSAVCRAVLPAGCLPSWASGIPRPPRSAVRPAARPVNARTSAARGASRAWP